MKSDSVFCHKCGARLDGLGDGPPGAAPTGDTASPGLSSPAQRFRNGAAGQGIDEEKTLWEGGYSAKAMAGAWVASLVATALLVTLAIWFWDNAAVRWTALAAVVLLWGYQLVVFARRWLGVRYKLTSLRFFHESGILVHTTDLIEVIDMDDITFRQTIIDRLVGVGTIRIVSSDRSHPDLSVPGIENVQAVAGMMQEARHAERLSRGLHIERI
ncbi:MAG: PH domain-containing protein [Pirellulales bacterium]|nr:PH domain-containing protein [Pirellulales bacterium]